MADDLKGLCIKGCQWQRCMLSYLRWLVDKASHEASKPMIMNNDAYSMHDFYIDAVILP